MTVPEIWKTPYKRSARAGGTVHANHPSGRAELDMSTLADIAEAAGAGSQNYWSFGCCGGLTRGDCGNTAFNCVTLNKTPCPTAYMTCTC